MNTPTASPTAPSASQPKRRTAAPAGFGDRWAAKWESLAPRERRMVSAAAWLVGLALLWWVALGPAIQTLRKAPAQHATLDAQLAILQTLAASAEQMRGQNSAPTPSRGAAQSSLDQATKALGETAQINIQGDKAILTLRGTPPQALAIWLNQVRVNARVVPVNAQLERGGNAADGWVGQITVGGPGLGSGAP
ncbi:MAG: type II secretion system protein GspM [Hydrogenophaga sp.]